MRGKFVNIEDKNYGNVTAIMELNDNELLIGLEGGNMCEVTIDSKKIDFIATRISIWNFNKNEK